MVKELLVDADIEAGRALLESLRRKRVTILATQWVQWGPFMRLAIVCPQVRTVGKFKLYTKVQELLDPAGRLELEDVMFVSPKTELGKRLVS